MTAAPVDVTGIAGKEAEDYEAMLAKGKGEWLQPGYVQDATWHGWIGAAACARRIEAAIRAALASGAPAAGPALADEATEYLEEVLNQSCRLYDGTLDSGAIRTYADAMRYLAKRGRFTIEREAGRRVIGRWTDERRAPEET